MPTELKIKVTFLVIAFLVFVKLSLPTKLETLLDYISCDVYGLTEGCELYNIAIAKLKKCFVNPPRCFSCHTILRYKKDNNIAIAGNDQADHDRYVASFMDAIYRKKFILNKSKTISSVESFISDYPDLFAEMPQYCCQPEISILLFNLIEI